MYKIFTFKRYVEQIIMFPFVLLGKLIAIKNPLQSEYDIYFFFPSFGIGGAERVNAEIIKAVSDKKVIIFFTKNSPNDGMKHFFDLPHVTMKEINQWTDNKWKYWGNLMYRGVCSRYINAQKKEPVVFIGQCNFAYKLTPHIRRGIRIHELIHMYDPKFTWVWAPFVQFIDTRIVIGEIFHEKFAACYEHQKIPLNFLKRFHTIYNCLEYLPASNLERSFELPLKIYYAGRGGPQKRVWIIIDILRRCRELKLPVVFKLAGSFKDELPADLIADGTYIGELKGGEQMYQLHKTNDILLMTSAWEGFPIVVMEAMAFGSIPLVTSVDAVPEHITDGVNGFLLKEVNNEAALVNETVDKIKWLVENRQALKTISATAYQYSTSNFSADTFIKEYRKVLLTP
jgi:glycosyltransferase involved in cell wall biosynthesis